MKLLRIGVVGGGRATEELTLPVLSKVKGVIVAGVCDIDLINANKLALLIGCVGYTNLEEMIEKEKIDAVIINTPVSTHADLAIRAMKAGAHVLMEKPAVSNPAELASIFATAQQEHKKIVVSHNYKFCDGPQQAEKMFRDGILGDIIHVDRVWMSPPHLDRMERDTEGWWHKMPGGRLADALPHMLYLPYVFVGPMQTVSVSARKLATDRPWSVCDESNITLKTDRAYVNIRQSTNQESWPSSGYTYHTLLFGTKLNVVFDLFGATILESHRYKTKVIAGGRALGKVAGRIIGTTPKPQSMRGGHNVLYERFVDYIHDVGPNPTSEEEIQNVVDLSFDIGTKMQACIDTGSSVII